MDVKGRMIKSIANIKGEVILRSDLEKFGSPSQVTRCIAKLIAEGVLVKVGYGVYAKAMINSLTGKPSPREMLGEIALEVFRRIGIEVKLGKALGDYADGKTTQIPMKLILNTGGKRVSRKLSVGLKEVFYENDYKSRSRPN